MVSRLAASMALLAFALCLCVGIEAGNSFATTVSRALAAMAATLVIGLLIGAMGSKMLQENLKSQEENLKNESTQSPKPTDK